MNGFYNKLGAGARPLNNKYPEVPWRSPVCQASMCLICLGLDMHEWHVQESRKWVRAILEEDFDMVIPAHTVSPVRDGKAAVRDAFAWLLEPQTA